MSWYSYDSTTIVGKVGRDAEMKYLNNGNPVTSFSVAVDRSYKPKDGETVKRTIWYSVQVFGKLAEVCNSISKGETVMVIGSLSADWDTGSPRTWEKKDGGVGTSFELNANEIKFLSPKKEKKAAEDDNPF